MTELLGLGLGLGLGLRWRGEPAPVHEAHDVTVVLAAGIFSWHEEHLTPVGSFPIPNLPIIKVTVRV